MDSANARMVREWIVMHIATLVKLEVAISARRTRLKFAKNALMVQHCLKMENVCVVIATKLWILPATALTVWWKAVKSARGMQRSAINVRTRQPKSLMVNVYAQTISQWIRRVFAKNAIRNIVSPAQLIIQVNVSAVGTISFLQIKELASVLRIKFSLMVPATRKSYAAWNTKTASA